MFTWPSKAEYYFNMTEFSLVYYGKSEEVKEHFLTILKVLKVLPATSNLSGFYLNEKKYGYESQRKISLSVTDQSSQDVLIYRYLSEEELNHLKNNKSDQRYHVLLHKYIDINYIRENINIARDNLCFLVGYTKSANIQSYHYIRKNWTHPNIAKINLNIEQIDSENKKDSLFNMPVFLLYLFKILINPVNELKRYSILLKYSNLRILTRFIELLIFIEFIFKAIIIKISTLAIQQIYYKSIFLIGLFRVLLIKIGFLIRHILLMFGFKSFGVFVDSYYFVTRCKDKFLDKVVYPIWDFLIYKFGHFLYYKIGYFLYFKIGHFLYYKIGYFLYYKVGHFLYYKIGHFLLYKIGHFLYYKIGYFLYYRIFSFIVVDIIYLNLIDVYYFTRHIFLMSLFKSYGMFYDSATFLYRISKLYLLYPFRKAYWFFSFQYNKRIKKYFI